VLQIAESPERQISPSPDLDEVEFIRDFKLRLTAMARKRNRSLRCPTCRTLLLADEDNFPFCSERCRLIDLGKWASGAHVISTPVTDPEKLEDMKAKNLTADDTDGTDKH
jgi:endogenous inhibitor of DNA gyrase (YacG/DUF329 family)